MSRGYDQKAKLLWSVPSELIVPPNPDPYDPKLPAPPPLTGRYYLSTPAGHLEILYALPGDATIESPTDDSWKSPVLFLHGGFGSANCYSNFLPWFAARGYPVYSLALRGHGRSWQPSFWGLYFTSKETLADDVADALRFIRKRHPGAGPTTLVGHSSGGGLSQHVVDSGKGEGVGKLVVLAGIPSFGGWRVYWNWLKLDPWFPIRVLWDLYHPRSPLSSTRLVHRAFFAPDYPIDKVRKFEAEMSYSESMSWPSGMMFPFVNRSRLLSNLVSNSSNQHAVLLTIGGAQDKLVSVPIMRRLANLYAATNVGIGARSMKLGIRNVSALQHEFTSGVAKEKNEGKGEGRVWFAEIGGPGAGHNLMRDDRWRDCARVIETFLEG